MHAFIVRSESATVWNAIREGRTFPAPHGGGQSRSRAASSAVVMGKSVGKGRIINRSNEAIFHAPESLDLNAGHYDDVKNENKNTTAEELRWCTVRGENLYGGKGVEWWREG